MATTTPNFGWPVPTSTDLVKDGATAIEALGDSIDASLLDLKGGTSGQVLAKNSNTDMDFIWVTDAAGDITGVTAGTGISGGGTSGTVTVTNSMATAIDAKGDLVAGTAADTFARLPVGTNGQVLVADSAEATGLKWATASGGGKVLQVVYATKNTVTTNTNAALLIDTGLTATITPTSATSKILVMFNHNANFRDNASNQLIWKFFRNATQIYEQSQMYLPISIGVGMEGTLTLIRMDEPATTSALTYKSQFRPSSGGTVTVQSDNFPSSLTLMEIGA